MFLVSFSDWLRLLNFILGIVIAAWLLCDKYGPWRSGAPRLIVLACAGAYFWLGYTGLEILLISRIASTAPEAARVIGGTFWMVLGVAALVIEHRRNKDKLPPS
jgi:hypothetical protein